MSLKDAKQFVAHYVTGDYTPTEYATFLRWLRRATINELNEIADEHEALHERWFFESNLSGSTRFSESTGFSEPTPEWITILEEKLDKVVEEKDEESLKRVRTFRTRRIISGTARAIGTDDVRKIGFGGFRVPKIPKTWAVAASVVVLLSAGAVVWFTAHHEHERSIIKEQGYASGSDLSTGPIDLSALSQSTVNPRGADMKQVTLADGSKVWLNAASTLKYPGAFNGPQRVVQLSGEAFFEIAPNAGKPFRVLIKDAEVAVLGTHFNIMAYEDEPVSKTTLIDGAVRMESASDQINLRSPIDLQPGQQAEITYPSPGVAGKEFGKIRIISGADPDAILAWKNGSLEFRNADLRTVMRAVSRCYNVELQYDQNLPDVSFTGGLKRQDDLLHVLKQLEGFLNLHFNTDGKNVTVTR